MLLLLQQGVTSRDRLGDVIQVRRTRAAGRAANDRRVQFSTTTQDMAVCMRVYCLFYVFCFRVILER